MGVQSPATSNNSTDIKGENETCRVRGMCVSACVRERRGGGRGIELNIGFIHHEYDYWYDYHYDCYSYDNYVIFHYYCCCHCYY